MRALSGSRRAFRFGAFAADLRSGELYKDGARVRLQEQPFRILGLLLERPGEVVTREELRQKLWPNDTFVDFDHGINVAIAKIREALGDSSEEPEFVPTIGRRVYRFIAPVSKAVSSLPSFPALPRVALPSRHSVVRDQER